MFGLGCIGGEMRTWWKGADAAPHTLHHSPELVLFVLVFSFESGESLKKKKKGHISGKNQTQEI